MIRARVTCIVSGPSFSPALAERTTGLALEKKFEPGEIDRLRPRSAGGRAEIPVQEYGAIAELAAKNAPGLLALQRSTEALRRAGATELLLKFDVEYAGGPCHFELPAELVKRLAEIAIPVVIACFPSDETEELGGRSLF
jgi:hypothetical protein